MSKADIVLHPVRFRILTIVTGRKMTAQQIVAALPDVAQASIYRHVNRLTEAGILQAMEAPSARGGVEKVFTIPTPMAATLSTEDMASVSYEDHIHYFTNYCALLMSKGRAYLRQKALDGRTGGIYSFEALYLTDAEYEHLATGLEALEGLALSNQPGPGRRRRLLFTAIIPDELEE